MLKQARLPVSLSIHHFASLLQKAQALFDSSCEQIVLQRKASLFTHTCSIFKEKKNHTHISVAATLAAVHPSVRTKSTGPVHSQRVPAHRGTPRLPQRSWCSFTNTSVQELHPTSRALSFCCLQEMESHCLQAHTPDHCSSSILNIWVSYKSQAKSPQVQHAIFFNPKVFTINNLLSQELEKQ